MEKSLYKLKDDYSIYIEKVDKDILNDKYHHEFDEDKYVLYTVDDNNTLHREDVIICHDLESFSSIFYTSTGHKLNTKFSELKSILKIHERGEKIFNL